MTDPKPGQRARLTIAEATWDSGYWLVPGGDVGCRDDTPGLSWEALPDPLPVEDREALYMDKDDVIWRPTGPDEWMARHNSGNRWTVSYRKWERLVRERGPLRRYTLDEP